MLRFVTPFRLPYTEECSFTKQCLPIAAFPDLKRFPSSFGSLFTKQSPAVSAYTISHACTQKTSGDISDLEE
ncbi:hypothetical protein CEXT_245171 [Caerostris extrusa]|uniref:Uncharacterized protein n=1 Tax=Caerostris extrusa TaxID=172846 RepID=A0AAV4XF67_CAEEX|nr:hypothetical protein CEXT_245171 [Caerostris extrusa]